MTADNLEMQLLMWKYKEMFVFPCLKTSKQIGELSLVKTILDFTKHPWMYRQTRWTENNIM